MTKTKTKNAGFRKSAAISNLAKSKFSFRQRRKKEENYQIIDTKILLSFGVIYEALNNTGDKHLSELNKNLEGKLSIGVSTQICSIAKEDKRRGGCNSI